ncbi:hypothetical protein EMCRGX_G024363 [Ephydatia muelleri]
MSKYITMANKRPAPKDFDASPRLIKQNRVEGISPIPGSQAFVFPTRATNHPLSSSASSQGGGGSPELTFLPQAVPAISISTSSPLVTGFTNAVPASLGSRVPQSLPGITTLQSHLTKGNPQPLVSPAATPSSGGLGSPLSTLSVPPPPYPSIGEVQNTDDFSCSSPSLFLCSPIPVRPVVSSQAATATATLTLPAEDHNRQPVCSLGDERADLAVGNVGGMSQHSLRAKVLKFKKAKMSSLKVKHELILKEKFFLEGGGNMMDFVAWKKKPNILRDQYLKQHDLDSDGVGYDDSLSPRDIIPTSEKLDTESILAREETLDQLATKTEILPHGQKQQSKASPQMSVPAGATATTIKAEVVVKTEPTTLTSMLTLAPAHVQSPLSSVLTSVHPVVQTPKITVSSPQLPSTATLSPQPSANATSNLNASYESSREDIVLRARHEAEIMRAISDLRKEGLWSASRLPKVQEPSRPKTHWDYLLEEMQWLAADFANERRWKMGASKKLCRAVHKHHQEHEVLQVKTEKEEVLKLRKIASTIAKEIKHFWDSVHKLVEHKHQVLLEEKRKKAVDMHLNFIVDQTAKYSKWLVQGLSSKASTEPTLQSTEAHTDSDGFFTPNDESEDDEETIEKEEKLAETEGALNYDDELQELQKEGEMPLDDLLASLPPEMLMGEGTPSLEDERGEGDMEAEVEQEVVQEERGDQMEHSQQQSTLQSSAVPSDDADADVDYQASGSEQEEDETTIAEQEEVEGTTDVQAELDALQQEGELPVEKLMAMYNLQPIDPEGAAMKTESVEELKKHSVEETEQGKREDEVRKDGEECAEEEDEEAEEEEEEEEEGPEQGIEFLVAGKKLEEACQTEKGLSDFAAVAEQFQPKGITLSTTEVRTKVPFLLKHNLREYQHIGLDWLVTMYDRKLNGILADEMGLGKTIQTIALLAHLACEKGVWGPHLVIVPTSVMLNWEYEFKKWCPAFKILTYFGTFKERKQKRVGWTKRNAFHVCITSYNIAVQDHRALKQKKWKYLILDEAQNIKNFKSQRWQTLLNFNSNRRLLLTGTPLQNNLMELWSLMHFLMPSVFSSHLDFKEWFSNPFTGMVEGSQEYNDSIVRRLHQVLRPFLLRRLKSEVEKQMPKKFEHIVMCRLSKRQRFLYDEYMSRTKTKETISAGNYLSVINVLMQLRKVCNHPDLFEPRPTVSPFRMEGLEYCTASLAERPLEYDPFKHISLDYFNMRLADYELTTEAFAAFRSKQLQAPRSLILDPSSAAPFLSDETDIKPSSFLEDLHVPNLALKLKEWAQSCRRHMYEVNSRRCRRLPMYGSDLIRTVTSVCCCPGHYTTVCKARPSHWLWTGYSWCFQHMTGSDHWENRTSSLSSVLVSYKARALAMDEIMRRFVITVPPVTAPLITLHTFHPNPSSYNEQSVAQEQLLTEVSQTRLIQYDCGKLQTLHLLLRQLKAGNHRVLVFTQMARVLDILEIFLNYHGHTYLRLDGATPILKRQVMMDRFNRDERIFCFILSTRSGGLGVNLTGADTVVFYDSDWNPTMDAQAQDRCHRIGQTRDVHIYRLICESTVEENILKKADQKRMLGALAIESGAFTTEFFKQASLQELFESKNTSSSQQEVVSPSVVVQAPPTVAADDMNGNLVPDIPDNQIEELLLAAEDESDVQAAKLAGAEQAADMAEFDENFSSQAALGVTEDRTLEFDSESKALAEFSQLEEQLTGVELYIMRFIEAENAEFTAEQLRIAEENIEVAKKEWELGHLQSLREEEERLAEEEKDDILLTYDRPEAANKMYIDKGTGEEMPMWLPPTPPADDDEDMYVDLTMEMLYDTSSVMSPARITTAYSDDDCDVFGLWRQSAESDHKKAHKSINKHSKEHLNVPQSLFWRRAHGDALPTKLRRFGTHTKKPKSRADQFTSLLEHLPDDPEWIVFEDWVLLKTVLSVLDFPLSLNISVPAQTPNWSVVADTVTLFSRLKRSPHQCRERFMNDIIPREDPTLANEDKYKARDVSIKKIKGQQDSIKNSILVDGGRELTTQFSVAEDFIIQTAQKRKQAGSARWEPQQKSSLHSELLKEYGITVDRVQSPMQIAQQRAERIQSELPRHGQVHQLLAGPTQTYGLAQTTNARTFHTASPAVTAAAPFFKPSDLPRPGFAAPVTRATTVPTPVVTPLPRFQTPSSTPFPAQAKLPGVAAGTGLSTVAIPPLVQAASSTHPSALSTAVGKTFTSVGIAAAAAAAGISVTAGGGISIASGISPGSTTVTGLTGTINSVANLTSGVMAGITAANVGDLSKNIIPLQGRNFTHNQHLLVLRQAAALHHQQAQAQQNAQLASTPFVSAVPQLPIISTSQISAAANLQHKVAFATSVEQLRPTIALAARQRPAISGIATAAGMKNMPEDMIAFLKQHAMKTAAQSQIAVSQSLRVEQQLKQPAAEGTVVKPPNPQDNLQALKLDILDPNKTHSPLEPSKYPKT